MRHIFAIARRELKSYFASPIAYVVMTIFTFMSGFFFSNMVVSYVSQSSLADRQLQMVGRSDIQLDVPSEVLTQFFGNESFLLMLALPLLTMGLISDERRKGTLELLVTSPVRSMELALGKFFGAFGLFCLMLVPILPMFYFLAQGGEWEPGMVAAGLLGLLMLAAAEIALGLLVSSLCENVLVSAFGTYGVLVTLNFIDSSSSAAKSLWVDFINFFSFNYHYSHATRGLVQLGDIAYFASYLVFALFMTQRSIEAIRFKRS